MSRMGPKPRPVMDRLLERSERRGECLVYLGACDPDGYGITWVDGHKRRSHRAAYEARHGVTLRPDEYVLHTCDNPPCFQDGHLYIGDQLQNMRDRQRRGIWPGGYPRATHCSHGHEYTTENTKRSTDGFRVCLDCVRDKEVRRVLRKSS